MEGESRDFRDEELLWCRMCTPGKSVSREYQRKLTAVIFNCLSWLFTSCTKETWSFRSCTNVVLFKSNVTYKPSQVPHIDGKHIYQCQASQVHSRFYPSLQLYLRLKSKPNEIDNGESHSQFKDIIFIWFMPKTDE